MSHTKRIREDYQKKQARREEDELKWFEGQLDKVEDKHRRRENFFLFVVGGIFAGLLILIWLIVQSRWLLFDLPPVILVAVGGVISCIGMTLAVLLERLTRKK